MTPSDLFPNRWQTHGPFEKEVDHAEHRRKGQQRNHSSRFRPQAFTAEIVAESGSGRRATIDELYTRGAILDDVIPRLLDLQGRYDIGLVLQLVGTSLAVRGLLQTWRAYSTAPFVPAWGRVDARLRSVAAAVRARLPERWRKSPSTVALAGTARGIGSAMGAITIAWDALPADQGAAIAELGRRVQFVFARVDKVDHESRTAIDRVRSDLGLGLDEEAAKREAADRAIATGGVKIALAGLLVIAGGIAVQSVAVLWTLFG